MTDSDILRLITESPPKGHRALFDEYYNYVCAIAARVLRDIGSPEDIDECVIDVFSDVILRLDPDRPESLKAYIGSAAKNKAISRRRSLLAKSGRRLDMDEQGFAAIPSGENIAGNAENKAVSELLMKEIAALGEPDSTIIIQRYFYSRKSAEISSIVGISPAAVRLRCSRALKKLRNALKGEIL
ncbi:MAG: sigma-70 family RNA polymerase sigma factor [Ruminococcus sp.]|nr:sigma-70 family RNA polymerase sigma factor [Ruminococcus sp.]